MKTAQEMMKLFDDAETARDIAKDLLAELEECVLEGCSSVERRVDAANEELLTKVLKSKGYTVSWSVEDGQDYIKVSF